MDAWRRASRRTQCLMFSAITVAVCTGAMADDPQSGTSSPELAPPAPMSLLTHEVPSPAAVPGAIPLEMGQGVLPSIGTACHPDFFIVNTKNCPQKAEDYCRGCRLIVHRYHGHRYHCSNLSLMLQSLQPGVPVCIFVHGSFVPEQKPFQIAPGRSANLLRSSGNRPIHLIHFHWPSDLGIPLLPTIQVNKLGLRAELNGVYLAELIAAIPPENPVSLLGHSHGSRITCAALHALDGGCIQGIRVANPVPDRRMRAVLGAAALDHHWLNPGERYGRAINRVEAMLNLRTRHDVALSLYPFREPHFDHALGKTGFRPENRQCFGWQAAKLAEFDVTRYVGCRHMIEAYSPHAEIRAAYIPYIYFD